MEASVEWEEISVAMLIDTVDYSSEKFVISNFNDPWCVSQVLLYGGKSIKPCNLTNDERALYHCCKAVGFYYGAVSAPFWCGLSSQASLWII